MADVGMATQRALDKTETMKARAEAVDELDTAGTFADLTALGPVQDDVDRQPTARRQRPSTTSSPASRPSAAGRAADPRSPRDDTGMN